LLYWNPLLDLKSALPYPFPPLPVGGSLVPPLFQRMVVALSLTTQNFPIRGSLWLCPSEHMQSSIGVLGQPHWSPCTGNGISLLSEGYSSLFWLLSRRYILPYGRYHVMRIRTSCQAISAREWDFSSMPMERRQTRLRSVR